MKELPVKITLSRNELIFYEKLTMVKVSLKFLKIVKEIHNTQFFHLNYYYLLSLKSYTFLYPTNHLAFLYHIPTNGFLSRYKSIRLNSSLCVPRHS